ncbi:MAG: hypothetical protein SFU98_02785 [Leptospiraceae bacterium]|nr:hypothetical protein [Leptospiraceae bacterium]
MYSIIIILICFLLSSCYNLECTIETGKLPDKYLNTEDVIHGCPGSKEYERSRLNCIARNILFYNTFTGCRIGESCTGSNQSIGFIYINQMLNCPNVY